MKKRARYLLLASLWCVPSFAQQANKVATFARNALTSRSEEIIAATIEMPADKFGFTPSPEEMTFGQLTLHVADGNYIYCSKIGGLPEPTRPTLSDADAKDTLVQRLRASFDFCTTAFSKLDGAVMSEPLTFGPTKTPRSMAILTLTGTWTDHFAMQTTYLKANGLAPPASKNQ
jgi:DinB superfamily